MIVALASIFFLNGCGVAYVVKQGLVHLSHMHKAHPIDKMLGTPEKYHLNKEEIRKLKFVQEVQKYAIEKIGLKQSDNYTSYLKLPHDPRALLYVVSASSKTKLEPYHWHFLIVGKVPYKGFFELEDAQTEAHYLRREGYDVYVRCVSAFSTLGWFDDPLYSTMLKLSDLDLADMIFHEMTHDTVYIKDNADLNESLATFVGSYATLNFIENKFGKKSEIFKNQQSRITDSKLFSKFVSKILDKLAGLYSSSDAPLALQKREEVFRSSKIEFKNIPFMTKDYSYFVKLPLNNAVLLSMNTYYADFEKFERELRQLHHKLPEFLKTYHVK